MRFPAAVLLLLVACGGGNANRPAEGTARSESRADGSVDREKHRPAGPVSDLYFMDPQLQLAAEHLIREAGLRGIEMAYGRNRLERLLWLEAEVGGSGRALRRANALVMEMTATDASQWGKLRHEAALEFGPRQDDVAIRVNEMLMRWHQYKSETVFRYLSSNYQVAYIDSRSWEKRFHEFVSERPLDAATWGWLLLRSHGAVAERQYGKATSETAYRFYLEFSGLGDGREARMIFSVPGIEIRSAR